MEPQVELMELIRKTISNNCDIEVCLDGTPKHGGVSAELGAGYAESLYYNKKSIRIIPVLFLSKGKDQAACLNLLCRICNGLQCLKQYPQAEGFSWLDSATATEPNLVGRQEDGQWIYSAIMNMKIYF